VDNFSCKLILFEMLVFDLIRVDGVVVVDDAFVGGIVDRTELEVVPVITGRARVDELCCWATVVATGSIVVLVGTTDDEIANGAVHSVAGGGGVGGIAGGVAVGIGGVAIGGWLGNGYCNPLAAAATDCTQFSF
jgi:hypothetical protein